MNAGSTRPSPAHSLKFLVPINFRPSLMMNMLVLFRRIFEAIYFQKDTFSIEAFVSFWALNHPVSLLNCSFALQGYICTMWEALLLVTKTMLAADVTHQPTINASSLPVRHAIQAVWAYATLRAVLFCLTALFSFGGEVRTIQSKYSPFRWLRTCRWSMMHRHCMSHSYREDSATRSGVLCAKNTSMHFYHFVLDFGSVFRF